MGDFRVTIEAIGGHGCGREAKDGEVVTRCGRPDCADCLTVEYVNKLRGAAFSGVSGPGPAVANVKSAMIEHWPVPGAAGTTRTEGAGPIDDLLAGTRKGQF